MILVLLALGCQNYDKYKFDGKADLYVKVANYSSDTKAFMDGSENFHGGRIISAVQPLTFDLKAAKGGKLLENVTAEQYGAGIVFENVESPDKLIVKNSNGKASYTSLDQVTFTDNKLGGVGLYAEKTDFGMPVHDPDFPSYDAVYKVNIPLSIPIACIIVKDIQMVPDPMLGNEIHIKHIKLDQIYLDGAPVEANIKYTEGSGYNSVAQTCPFAESWNDFASDAKRKSLFSINVGEDFVNDCIPVSLPVQEGSGNPKYYVFPLFAHDVTSAGTEGELPQLRFHFSGAELKGGGAIPSEQYVVVDKYLVGGKEIKAFEPGKIYKIDKLKIGEMNFSIDPNEKTIYSIDATVELIDWISVKTTAKLY